MKNITLYALTFLMAASASGQTSTDQIRSLREQSNAAIARHDAPAVASFLDDQYQITTGSGDVSWGGRTEELAAVFALADDVLYVRTPESIEVSSSGSRAAEIGRWVGSWTTAEGPRRIGGRYAAHWQEVDGSWKIRAELFVTLSCEGVGCS